MATTNTEVTIVCISDTHNYAPKGELPAGDVLIHAGDFTTTGLQVQVDAFLYWFRKQPHAVKVFIPGNHETTLHADFYERHWRVFHNKKQDVDVIRSRIALLAPDVIFLDGITTKHVVLPNGVKLYGSPWTPEFNNWAFGYDHDVDVWNDIPEGTDVVVTHGPPYGILDKCEDGRSVGCPFLREHILERVHPKLHVFGHIHHSHGACAVGGTQFVNASMCTEDYFPENAPFVVTITL